jgi:hypothetical protein
VQFGLLKKSVVELARRFLHVTRVDSPFGSAIKTIAPKTGMSVLHMPLSFISTELVSSNFFDNFDRRPGPGESARVAVAAVAPLAFLAAII